jgi:hypothetical protein
MRAFVTILAVLMVSGCSANLFDTFGSLFVTEEARQAKNAPSIPFTSLIRSGSGSPKSEGFATVLRSQADLDALLASYRDTIFSTYLLESKLALDFSQEQGVFLLDVVGDGSIEIVSIEEKPDRFIVRSIRWRAAPGERRPAIVIQPVHYISMRRSEKPVEFAAPVEAYKGSL